MPIDVTLLPNLRLAIAEGRGRVDRNNIEAYFSELREAGAGSFGKLIDFSRANLDITLADVAGFVSAVKLLIQKGEAGPIAFVVRDETGRTFALPFLNIPGVDRRGEIFQDRSEARRWLDRMLAEYARKVA